MDGTPMTSPTTRALIFCMDDQNTYSIHSFQTIRAVNWFKTITNISKGANNHRHRVIDVR
ncbi:MAG: hypothetical protein IPF58_11485 [Saprospirales bacterium]|nr:hypothetical protein [Saprospirales bacterium]